MKLYALKKLDLNDQMMLALFWGSLGMNFFPCFACKTVCNQPVIDVYTLQLGLFAFDVEYFRHFDNLLVHCVHVCLKP